MRQFLIGIVAIFSLLSGAISIAAETPEAMHEQRMARLTEELGLTAEQKPKVDSILQEEHASTEAVIKKYQGNVTFRTKREIQADMKTIGTHTMEKMSAVLTPEQLDKFKAIRARNREAAHEQIKERLKAEPEAAQ